MRNRLTLTFTTGTDFDQARSQALLGGDAKTLVGWVLLFAGKNRARWREAVGWDSLHLDLLLKLHVDGPAEKLQHFENNSTVMGDNLSNSIDP